MFTMISGKKLYYWILVDSRTNTIYNHYDYISGGFQICMYATRAAARNARKFFNDRDYLKIVKIYSNFTVDTRYVRND